MGKRLIYARHHQQQGNLDKALEEYRAILQEDPRDPQILEAMGSCLLLKGWLREGIERLGQAANLYGETGRRLKAEGVRRRIGNLLPRIQGPGEASPAQFGSVEKPISERIFQRRIQG
jgi:tetratricopeptide (TPR) repeat protein